MIDAVVKISLLSKYSVELMRVVVSDKTANDFQSCLNLGLVLDFCFTAFSFDCSHCGVDES